MKLATCVFSLVTLGASLFADESTPIQLLKGEDGQTMAAVAALASSAQYNVMLNKHAFWIMGKQTQPSGAFQESLTSFIAFKNQLIYSHAGNTDLFKKCTVFRLRDSLEMISGQSLFGTDDDYEGGMIATQEGDVYLFCNFDLLFYIDEKAIEKLMTNAESIEEAAMALLDAAQNQGADDNVNIVVIEITPYSAK